MGVPKFYRWISERYPCLSEVVKEYQIPEFDNLYLDMNGIIHVCSHPNDSDPHFRMTEEKMFKDIFHYIEVLFRLVQPKNVFFMAVDGVAPRAKMNQQRGRRFRSAREALDAEKKATERGEVLPTEERFDSNCITPGTPFMERLDNQLQYFVTCKVSQDKLWQSCKVIYSGHQTPGEGEHKIMEYIRYTKSQPGYNPNTRHCLYGLDADLIMLGLTSHEPHFCLLREEVRFGGKKDSNCRTPTPEETTFHLLHLSLMREYLSYEFSELKLDLPFPYDLENIIDDWVLMGFLVGNDFIPHLPNLHINKDALPTLYGTYKEVLPTLDGYLNIGGKLHLARFEKFVKKLAEFEINNFHELNADLQYFNAKKAGDGSAFKVNKGGMELKPFDFDDGDDDDINNLKTFERLGIQPNAEFLESDNDSDDDDAHGQGHGDESSIFEEEFRQHKREYYMTKMHYKNVNSAVLMEQATCYVRGIQWILNYYYNGICSWAWYYPYHYAPYISDVRNFSNMKLEFEMGKPFMPYEQLLAVLPPLSKTLLPEAYQTLMIHGDSPLKEYYPETFETDLNGKQQDWEAVVLIPFIDEEKLLNAMSLCNDKLTQEQKNRNIHGPMYVYSYTPDNLGEYKAPKNFPSVGVNHASVELVHRAKWEILPEKIYKGLCKDAKQELYFAGFPTLKHVKHKFHISKEAVKVFQQNSRGENFILDVLEHENNPDLKDLANQLLGKTVFIAWPHLVEAKVQSVSSASERYYFNRGEVQQVVSEGSRREEFYISRNSIASNYHDRWGINVGTTDILIFAAAMTGRRYVPSSSGRISLEKSWSSIIQPYAYQVVVRDIAVHDPGYKQHLTPEEYFPPRTKVFMLGQPHYGSMGEVIEIDPSHKGRIRVVMTVSREPNFDAVQQKQEQLVTKYLPGYHTSQKLGISSHLLARLTGTVFLVPPSGDNSGGELEMKNKLNIGLNLKNNKKNEEVVGYTRKAPEVSGGRTIWLYSQKTVEAIREYQIEFPEIFVKLSEQVGEKDIFFQDEVFGPEQYKVRVAKLTTWLKESNFAKAERRKCGTLTLDDAIISRIVEEVDKATAVRARAIKMQVRPHLLYKPNPLQGSSPPDLKVTFKLFDRVINCREGFSVPLGAKGTITGIQPADKQADVIYDILFDEPFPEGLTLGGPTTVNRCYRLHWATMINICNGFRCNSSSNESDAPLDSDMKDNETRPSAWNSPHQDQQMHQKWQLHRQQPEEQSASACFGYQPRTFQSPQNRKGQGNNYKSSRNNQEGEIPIPQPPDANQLPSPLGLYGNSPSDPYYSRIGNGGSDTKREFDHRNQQEVMVEILSANEVDCIVHGSYYAYWSKINQQGLSKVSGRNILCFSCIPRVIPGPKAFQLHIYIDVKKAMEDGIKFYRISDRQVACSGDQQGFIRTKYFIKVVDCETNSIIFPFNHGGNIDTVPWNSGGRQSQFSDPAVLQGQGRGRALGSQPPQGMQLFKNIWSQVQREDREHVDLRPMQSQVLSKMLNISGDNASSAAIPASNNGRTEVSVQDIFMGAMGSNPVHDNPSGNQTNVDFFPVFQGSHQIDSQNTVKTRGMKGDSPSKSAFVPTQVIRNQTPRKPRSDQPDESIRNQSDAEEQLSAGTDMEKPQMLQPQRQPQQQQHSNKNKPKRQSRNRLAVKFGQPSMEDT